jgi:carbamoyl-phosphate synthase small subunit
LKLLTQPGGYLLLEDGTKFTGDCFFGDSPALGEAVFNTSHTGYQEIISDPSYYRQLITFTAPHIGNVGVNSEDLESPDRRAGGVIIKSLPPRPRNWRAKNELAQWLAGEDIPMLVGANTRGITLHLRDRGAMRAGLFPEAVDSGEALEQVTNSESMTGADLAKRVTTKQAYDFNPDDLSEVWHQVHDQGQGLKVGVLDFGVKRNILRELACRGCAVTILPAATTSETILAAKYDGLLLSNGPGDPAAVGYGVETIRSLLSAGLPLFGICLGHQLLALAAGGSTFKLPFGHRGANHPVRCETDRTIEITSQNHGFAVTGDRLPDGWQISHINLNDQTVEGLRHRSLPVFSIQYHPEASPGPHEGHSYFDQFIKEMRRAQA